ncbi:MAG: TIGR00725 family protein [bacterium]|nr:TIGR00725 family protein [bacterium]
MQIGVIGASTCSDEIGKLAFQVGREIAKAQAILICGGLGGVMEAACRGAKEVGGLTIGILPGARQEDANPFVDIKIITGLSYARNIIVVRSSCAVIAISGGYGTLSEIAYALNLGVPVIGLNTWELKSQNHKELPIIRVDTPWEAVKKAVEACMK